MKTIGLIGGASSESTEVYYRLINQKINHILGGHHCAKIVLVNLDFDPIVNGFFSDDWSKITDLTIEAAQKLERAGVDCIAICCNTLHKIADQIINSTTVPFLHILNPIGTALQKNKINKVGLLGTKFTLNGDFHKDYLKKHFQINNIIPSEFEIENLNKIIFNELCHHDFKKNSQKIILNIIENMQMNGAQAIILGCTELHLLINQSLIRMPIFDSTFLHANAIAQFALDNTTELSENQLNLEQIL